MTPEPSDYVVASLASNFAVNDEPDQAAWAAIRRLGVTPCWVRVARLMGRKRWEVVGRLTEDVTFMEFAARFGYGTFQISLVVDGVVRPANQRVFDLQP